MKIHELRFENLNSLYGEWVIDFRHPDYQSHGIFALTGPTGSGKSTILDAVCLSLYGMTPRLGRITKSSNEIISRKTGSCYAELLFETSEGLYRCRWEQRRARKKPDGALQDPDHQIWDESSGTILESKKSLVPALIEQKTGMDFDRFTRSMLLAQGAFDTFLKADTEEKSKILEQITGTAIYSDISQAVHERRRSEQQKLQLLEHELSSIAICDDQPQADLEEQLQTSSAELDKLIKQDELLQKAISWRLDLDGRSLEIKKLEQDVKSIEDESAAFKPKQIQLEMALKAASVEPSYAHYTSLSQQLEQETKHHTETSHQLTEKSEELENLKSDYEKRLQNSRILKDKQRKLNPVLSEVIVFDERMETLTKRCEEIGHEIKQISESTAELITEIADKKSLIEGYDTQLDQAHRYIEEHPEDEQLVTGFSGIRSQLAHLRDLYTSLESDTTRLKQAEAQSQRKEEEQLVCKKQTADVQQAISSAQKHQEALGKQLKELLGDRKIQEYRERKEALLRELALHNRIEELEHYRSRLTDGSPCPLCGALDHPYAEGNIPEKDACEQQIEQVGALLQTADSLQEDISLAQKHVEKIRADLQSQQKREAETLLELQRSQDELSQCKQSVETDEKKLTTQILSVQQTLVPLGVEQVTPQDADSLIEKLELRFEQWNEIQQTKAQLKDLRSNVEKSLLQLQNKLTTRQDRKHELEQQLKTLKEQLETIQKERFELFGDRDPKTEQQKLQDEIDQADLDTEEMGKTYTEIQQAAAALKQELKSTGSRIQEYNLQRDRAHEQFISDLREAGFADEQDVVSARMDAESRKQLEEKHREINERLNQKLTLLDDARKRYTGIEEQQVTDKTAQELDEASQELKGIIEHVRENVLQLKQQLSAHQEALKQHEKKLKAVHQQKRECETWDRLHMLIGSADGKKFRNFAQGLTFSVMISQANRQLELMSDRYLLIKDETHPLELNVIDTYQAGEIRSTKNLSGGESFIVSLSLALGLSAMSGQSVRVDSLFLDEGFGTLDEQALETALETLAVLQQEGKLIGIISHVGALKERISTQITVIPKTGGKSVIQGPGCRSII